MSAGNNKVYTTKEMESAVELARQGGYMGYYTLEAMQQYIAWAVEFEQSPYDEDNWLELLEDFGSRKMQESVDAGEASFIMPKVSMHQIKQTLAMMKEAGLTLQDCVAVFSESDSSTQKMRMRG